MTVTVQRPTVTVTLRETVTNTNLTE